MRKYGIEHFHISLLEETDNPEEREVYWIEQKRSFKNGYNATMGGDGKKYIDWGLVIATYQELQNQKETALKLGISPDTVHNILTEKQIPINLAFNCKTVKMLNKDNKLIKVFSSMADAAQYLIDNGFTKCKKTTIRYHISEVCQGTSFLSGAYNRFSKRKFYGYKPFTFSKIYDIIIIENEKRRKELWDLIWKSDTMAKRLSI